MLNSAFRYIKGENPTPSQKNYYRLLTHSGRVRAAEPQRGRTRHPRLRACRLSAGGGFPYHGGECVRYLCAYVVRKPLPLESLRARATHNRVCPLCDSAAHTMPNVNARADAVILHITGARIVRSRVINKSKAM